MKIPTTYFNNQGDEVTYYRTARVDKKAVLSEIYLLFQAIAKTYLLHQYFVISDNIFWRKFKTTYQGSMLTIDYSENLNFKPKFEAQSAHFSGRQRSLHLYLGEK